MTFEAVVVGSGIYGRNEKYFLISLYLFFVACSCKEYYYVNHVNVKSNIKTNANAQNVRNGFANKLPPCNIYRRSLYLYDVLEQMMVPL